MANSLAGEGRDKESRAPCAAAVPARDGAKTQGQLRYSLPWVAILFITAGFHFHRGVPLDGWIFMGVATVLGIDLLTARLYRSPAAGQPGTGPGKQPQVPAVALRLILALAAAGATAVAVLAPLDSPGIAAVVGVLGALLLVLAWPQAARSAQGNSKAMQRAAWWWGAVLLFLALWELGSYFTDELDPAVAPAVPPLTDLLQPLFDGAATRWLMVLLWLAACAALLRVSRRP